MNKFILLIVVVFVSGCVGSGWKHDLVSMPEIGKQEATAMIRAAENHYQMPALRIGKETDGRIRLLLGEKRDRGGLVVWFKKQGDHWVEDGISPHWE